MRGFQVTLFVLGVGFLVASVYGIGKSFGETLFHAGIAFLLIDVVCILLWPRARQT